VNKDDVSVDVAGNEARVYGEIKQREHKGILADGLARSASSTTDSYCVARSMPTRSPHG
jgi:hypothetical protein